MKKNDKNGDKINEEEENLWKQAIEDVTPLEGKNDYISSNKPTKPSKTTEKPHKSNYRVEIPDKNTLKIKKDSSNEVDKRNLSRFRSGKMPIEARIDLHNMNQQQAHDSLTRFIISAHASRKRCVLVITGKGDREKGNPAPQNADWLTPEAGILRKRVPDWLKDPALKPLILQTAPAQPKDGGTGALYILLRRQR